MPPDSPALRRTLISAAALAAASVTASPAASASTVPASGHHLPADRAGTAKNAQATADNVSGAVLYQRYRITLADDRAREYAARHRAHELHEDHLTHLAHEAALRHAAAERAAAQENVRASTDASTTAQAPDPQPQSYGSPEAYAESLVGTAQFGCLYPLWQRESGWDYTADNPSTGAYGIPQALPGGKMASAGADWQTDPDTQVRWGVGYIDSVYGSPCAAWAHEQADGWY